MPVGVRHRTVNPWLHNRTATIINSIAGLAHVDALEHLPAVPKWSDFTFTTGTTSNPSFF